MLKTKILKRPENISKIYDEALNITERALVFKPMYKITATHLKTQKKVAFRIDGVTGKIVPEGKGKIKIQGKTDIKKIGLKIYSTSKDKMQQFIEFLYPKNDKSKASKKQKEVSK